MVIYLLTPTYFKARRHLKLEKPTSFLTDARRGPGRKSDLPLFVKFKEKQTWELTRGSNLVCSS